MRVMAAIRHHKPIVPSIKNSLRTYQRIDRPLFNSGRSVRLAPKTATNPMEASEAAINLKIDYVSLISQPILRFMLVYYILIN